MGILKLAAIFGMVAIATAELGTSNMHDWAYQWYEDEEFSFKYVPSNSTQDVELYVVWESPNHGNLTTATVKADDPLFEVKDTYNVVNGELRFKKITSGVHGVYICWVTLNNDHSAIVNRTIFGLNIREKRYRSMSDKYSSNIIVAVVATAVFIVPLITICVTYRFSYENRKGIKPKRKYMQNGDGYDMTVANTVAASEKGAYENPEVQASHL